MANQASHRKDGAGSAGIIGQRYCKGICGNFEKIRPYRHPFDTHVLCTNCVGTGVSAYGVWQERANLNEKDRCPCCNRLPRGKSRSKTKPKTDTHKRWEKGISYKKPTGTW
jgi:hypothetical protein